MSATLPIAHGDAAQASIPRSAVTPVPKRHPAMVRVTHWLTTIVFFILLISGAEIVLSHPRFYWGETGNINMHPWLNLHLPSSRSSVPTGYGYTLPDENGWSRYLHFEAAWGAVATGLLYVLWGIVAGHFRRNLVPTRADLKGLRASVIEHLRFSRPGADELWSYNVLQRLAYLVVIFVLFPLMIWTGLAMSFGFNSAFPLAVRLLGGQQSARSLHFLVTILLVLFLVVHVLMVVVAGFRARMRAMITGRARLRRSELMISRRKLISTGIAMAAGASGVAVAARLAQRHGLIPPDSGGFYGPGETLTYAAQRLLNRNAMAREFSRSEISKDPFPNIIDPALPPEFHRFEAANFTDWRVTVDGMAARPTRFSLAKIKSFPTRSQITMIGCEEGWTYIAEWTGAPLSYVLERVGALPQVRYVVYRSIQRDDWWESIDMADALHPQTLLAHKMNGADLPVPFGGPLRMRLARQLGYKNVKFIDHITLTDSLKAFGKGTGGANSDTGYAWYAGI
ncbi:MAG TPA: molybdopterin-dependent oxidoreductase [Candidatus Sulfotelmatobacter sp.]|nr:molybdopterin-dependent oxidoreductase [Candidatus Sulfotelmatobacter sp.]